MLKNILIVALFISCSAMGESLNLLEIPLSDKTSYVFEFSYKNCKLVKILIARQGKNIEIQEPLMTQENGLNAVEEVNLYSCLRMRREEN